MLTDAVGNLTSSASHDSYGNSANNIATRYQYTGREKDADTGLYYYRARWYDSNLGRFIPEDPIGLNGGINQFGYVRGNPLSFRDPSGKIPVLIPVIIGVGILIATSPSYVNAPGPNDQVYLDDKGSGLFINAAAGSACSLALRGAAPYVGALINKLRIGDDIIELGISRGPHVPGPQLGEFGIPKYYGYAASNGEDVFFTLHAMKHLEDLANHGGGNPRYLKLIGDIHKQSLESAVDDILSRGPIKYNHMYRSGEVEIMFGAPRTAQELPAVIHFRQLSSC